MRGYKLVRSELGKSEIENFGVLSLSYKNIGRLDVAVDDSLRVGRIQGIGDLDADRQQGVEFQGTARDVVLQCCAVKKLHGDERLPVLVVDFVDGADVRVIQRGCSFGFALKTAESLRIFRYFFGEEFEGNKPPELDVFGFVDDTHAAATELFNDAVVGDGLPDEGRGVRHLADMLGCKQRQVNESRGARG